jgi:pimeloyl-ACP methyl ester carboxylesterase
MEIKYSENLVIQSEKHGRSFLIDIRYLTNNKPKPLVLFIHGFKGFKDWGPFNIMADYFANAGFVFVKMNFSHNGTTIDQPLDFADLEAFGNNNFSIEQEDIQTVLDQLMSGRHIPAAEVNLADTFLLGHSRGGAAAILKASTDERVRKLVTLAAMNDLSNRYSTEVLTTWKEQGVLLIYNARTEQDMPLNYQIVQNYLDHKELLDVKQAVVQMNKPFLAFHGTADETLPLSMLHEIKQWNNKVETIEIPDANHTFGGVHPYNEAFLPKDLKSVVDLSINFFKQGI